MSHLNCTKILAGLEDTDINILAISSKIIKGINTHVLVGELKTQPTICSHCRCRHPRFTKYGFRTVQIRLLSSGGKPMVLSLKKQRFLCTDCGAISLSTCSIVQKHCCISNMVKAKIALDLSKKVSEKDIAKDHNVSFSSVHRIVDSCFQRFYPPYNSLPLHLCFDEFKSTKRCKGAMSFIYCDATTHEILDIVENRQLYFLRRYFQRFTKQARRKVQTVTIDMYSPYISLIEQMFPNAKIILDSFHLYQHISRALNKTRIDVMKTLPTKDQKYKQLKRYWKLLLQKESTLDATYYRKFTHFKERKTKWGIVQDILKISPTLYETYQQVQQLYLALESKNIEKLETSLTTVSSRYSQPMKVVCKTLLSYLPYIKNTFQFPFTNGPLEGINNYIKTLKRIAFGYRSFFHMRNRILISCKLILPTIPSSLDEKTIRAA